MASPRTDEAEKTWLKEFYLGREAGDPHADASGFDFARILEEEINALKGALEKIEKLEAKSLFRLPNDMRSIAKDALSKIRP